MLKQTGFDWETVLFYMLAKNFGLNANGAVFLKMAQAIPFSVIRKENFETENLESLFFGTIGLLDADMQDSYFGDLQFRYNYQAHKYRLKQIQAEPVQFFKHRPDNFPTIRLAQLASLYHQRHQLFSDIIAADSTQKIYALFDVGVSDYWQRHYLFDRENNFKKKVLSSSFINLIIINTIVPIRFEYAKSKGKEISETLLSLLKNVPAEKNAVVGKFATFGINAQNAFESQALLQLKNEYCSYSKCMQCAIGTNLLKE